MSARSAVVFLNGHLVRAGRARVSVYDRGLLFGDGLFETARAYRGRVFALEEHLSRLRTSAAVLGIPVPDYDWAALIQQLLRRNRLEERDAAVRITLTRGAAEPNLLPPADPHPTCIAMARPVDPSVPTAQRRGVRVALLPFARGDLLAEHKVLDYVPGILGRTLAVRQGCSEGVYVDGKIVREGITASLFMVRRQSLLTPRLDRILPGITRRVVLDLAAENGIRCAERQLTVDDLLHCSEAFLCSSVAEIVPVVAVGRQILGDGHPGPLTRALQRLYRRRVRAQQGHPGSRGRR